MGFFKNLFTWWEGASTGTALYSWRNGGKVGSDPLGRCPRQIRAQVAEQCTGRDEHDEHTGRHTGERID